MKKSPLFLSFISLFFLAGCASGKASSANGGASLSSQASSSKTNAGSSTSNSGSSTQEDELPESYTAVTDAGVSITAPGAYYLKGYSFTSVSVALTEKGSVVLYLDGATIAATSKAITVSDDFTESLTIVLLNGSENTITAKKNAVDSTADVYVVGSASLAIICDGDGIDSNG